MTAELSTSVAPLVAVIYVSSATRLLNDEELSEILQTARTNNERADITGMLLYRDGNFLQVLEGPAEAVDSLVAKIKLDPRHRGVILMSRRNVEERQFEDWRMAFRNMSKSVTQEEGFSPFMEADFDGDEAGEESQLVYRLLNHFKYGMR